MCYVGVFHCFARPSTLSTSARKIGLMVLIDIFALSRGTVKILIICIAHLLINLFNTRFTILTGIFVSFSICYKDSDKLSLHCVLVLRQG